MDHFTGADKALGSHSVSTLLVHYCIERSAETLQGKETIKEVMISLDISPEWKTCCQVMSKQPKTNIIL